LLKTLSLQQQEFSDDEAERVAKKRKYVIKCNCIGVTQAHNSGFNRRKGGEDAEDEDDLEREAAELAQLEEGNPDYKPTPKRQRTEPPQGGRGRGRGRGQAHNQHQQTMPPYGYYPMPYVRST